MQILLLLATIILAIILYKMLNRKSISYPYIRTTVRYFTEEQNEYDVTETEHGIITIDKEVIIVEGKQYFLKTMLSKKANARLEITDNKVKSICIELPDGEKWFHIDPEHNAYVPNDTREYTAGTQINNLLPI